MVLVVELYSRNKLPHCQFILLLLHSISFYVLQQHYPGIRFKKKNFSDNVHFNGSQLRLR